MFKWLINMKLRGKFLFFTISVIMVTIFINIIMVKITIEEHEKENVKDYRKTEIMQFKETLKNYINIVETSIIFPKMQLVRRGKLSFRKAKV